MKRATVLAELAAAAVRRAEELRGNKDLDVLYQEALLFEKRDFAGALRRPGLAVISEIKRASPSAGFIREADPAEWGARYEAEGASCISILTEPERFQGSLQDLDAARESTALPILRKDFTVDEAQVLEAGTRADAVLLIAALFDAAARNSCTALCSVAIRPSPSGSSWPICSQTSRSCATSWFASFQIACM